MVCLCVCVYFMAAANVFIHLCIVRCSANAHRNSYCFFFCSRFFFGCTLFTFCVFSFLLHLVAYSSHSIFVPPSLLLSRSTFPSHSFPLLKMKMVFFMHFPIASIESNIQLENCRSVMFAVVHRNDTIIQHCSGTWSNSNCVWRVNGRRWCSMEKTNTHTPEKKTKNLKHTQFCYVQFSCSNNN